MSRPRITAAARIQRLLALLNFAAQWPEGVLIADLCDRFGFTQGDVVKELEMAGMIGADLPNYDDMPFEVFVEDGRVFVRLFAFNRPMRLSPAEGLALVVAADALVDEDDPEAPLARALRKLGTSLGIDLSEAVEVDLGPEGGDVGRLLRAAVTERRRVGFRYWTYGRDQISERVVSPWSVFNDEDAWYLAGHDHDRDAERRFRLDRMQDVVLLAEPAHLAPDGFTASVSLPDAGPQVVLDLAAEARWVVEAYPVLSAEQRSDGALRVTLSVTGTSWLERLLVRLGPAVSVVSMDSDIGPIGLGARASERVLRRYRDSSRAGAR